MAFGVAVAVVSHSFSSAGLKTAHMTTIGGGQGVEVPEVQRGAGQHQQDQGNCSKDKVFPMRVARL